LIDMGYKKWEIANYWGLGILPTDKLDVSFDNLIYMFNPEAAQMAKEIGAGRITLAVEDCLSNLKNMAVESPLPVALVVYQDVPLFTSAVCVREGECKDCGRGLLWMEMDREGQKFDVLSKDCQVMVFDKKPYCIAKEAKEIRADFYRADFVYKDYDAEEVAFILNRLMRFEDVAKGIKGNVARINEMF